MRRQLTFIHAADLHLGAPFRGLRALPESWANRLYNAIPEAYDRLGARYAADDALVQRPGLVVVAAASQNAQGNTIPFVEGERRFVRSEHGGVVGKLVEVFLPRGIGVVVSRAEVDGNISLLQPAQTVEEMQVSQSQAGRAAAPHAALAPFAVGVVHSGLNLDPYKAPANPAEMLAAGMDYWALGHIHKRFQFPSETDPRIVFSGCIQGRDIKETGARGCCLVTLTEGAANKIEFVPTASVVWQRLTVNVEDCRTLADVQSHITRGLFRVNGKAHCEQMLARITLTGSTDLHAMLEREDVRKDICARINEAYPAFYCDVVIDSTCAVRDMAALAEEGLFPSLVLRVANNMREDEQTEFIQEELVRRGIELPNNLEKRLDEYTQTAKNIVLDALMDGGDA